MAIAVIAALAACGIALAGNTWDGGGTNNDWNTPANWASNVLPPNDGTAYVTMAGATRPTPTISVPWAITGLSFAAGAAPFTISAPEGSSGSLTLGDGGISNQSTSLQSIGLSITLTAPQYFDAYNGDIVIPQAFPRSIELNGNNLTVWGSHNTTIGCEINGAGNLTKSESGTLILTSINGLSYTGTTTVNGGTIEYHTMISPYAPPTTGSVIIGDGIGGAEADVFRAYSDRWVGNTAGTSVTVNSSGLLDLQGGFPFIRSLILNGGHVRGMAGNGLYLTDTLTVNATSNTALISGCGVGILEGITATITVADGEQAIDLDFGPSWFVNNGTMTKTGSGTMRITSPLAGVTNTGRTLVSQGTLLLAAPAGPSLPGDVEVWSILRQQAAGQFRPTANLVVNYGGTADLGGFPTTLHDVTVADIGSTTLSTGAATLTVTGRYSQTGGVFNGTLLNKGEFAGSAGTFNGRMINEGTYSSAAFTFGNGVENRSVIQLLSDQSMTANGAGLDNQRNVYLVGGTLNGAGPLVNNAVLSGYGTVGGSGVFTNNAQVTVNGGNLTLATAMGVDNYGTIDIEAGRQLILGSGTTFANAGSLNLAGNTVSGGLALINIAGGALAGRGTVTAPLFNGGLLMPQDGTLSVVGGFTNGGEILLGGGASALAGSGTIDNTGLVRGDGRITKNLNNNTFGELRAEAGKRLQFAGAVGANLGLVSLQGGTVEFSQGLTNAAGGAILGRGTLIAGGAGLVNNGQIGFSGGFADVYGDVANASGAQIVVSGGGTATFYDDVVNDGSLFRISQSCAAVFFGGLSGGGSFSGTGTVYIEGDLRPGHSPAAVTFEGDLVMGSGAALVAELGGTLPGSQYDTVTIGGQAALDGTLEVDLLYGFRPQAGQTFDILNFDPANLSGEFDAINLPDLGGGLAWDTSNLYTTGALGVVPEPATLALLAMGLATLATKKRQMAGKGQRTQVGGHT